MNNFELNEKAQQMVDTLSPYQLAKMILMLEQCVDDLEMEQNDLRQMINTIGE